MDRGGLRRFWQGASWYKRGVALFLQQPCAVCDRATSQSLCIDCRRQIAQVPRFEAANLNSSLPVIALSVYSGCLKQAILALKYSDRPDVAQCLGFALAEQWQAAVAGSNVLTSKRPSRLYAIPIPLHPDRQASRGYNQAELIAKFFCQASHQKGGSRAANRASKQTGVVELLPHGLKRIRATQPQHALTPTARQKNLEQVFQTCAKLQRQAKRAHRLQLPQPAALLIDDIYTTGATAQSAAATLRTSGVDVVGIATVARAMTQRQSGASGASGVSGVSGASGV